MIVMRNLFVTLMLVLALVVIIMPVVTTAATTAPSESKITVSVSPTQSHIQAPPETPVKVTITPLQTPRRPPGEVEVPMTPRITRTPTIPRTTEPATRTETPTTTFVTQTTVSATQTIPAPTTSVTQTTTSPVVTVTIPVYPSYPVYRPAYYYPPGYPNYDTTYYPPAYPYDASAYYSTGSLTVTSSPSDAVVIVDGYNSEATPFVFTGLTTGYHTVEVDYPGYEAYITDVYIENGAGTEVNADLVPLVNYGSLFVDSTPRGADVYLDGNYQGTSPITVSMVSEGDHQVELHLAGYEVLTSTENVISGQGTTVNLVMVPYSSSSDTGSIDITSNLPGALVYLDGIYKGSIQSGTIFNVIAVSPGTHTVLLHLPGYTDVTRTVQVSAGQIADLNAVFTPSPSVQQSPATASPATGSIVVTSSPSGGQVSVDNQFRGVAPVTIYNVAPGTHIINMQLTGYSNWSTSVDVPANQIVQVPATLTPISGTLPVPTRAGLSPVTIIGALAVGAGVLSSRIRR
jgi:hypothetical protein